MNKDRNEIFQKLKPPCVNLSQIALTWGRRPGSSRDIVTSLEALLKVLKQVVQSNDAFDKNLADYVFFPLSHVFRPNTGIPERALELALQCLDLLFQSGWRHGLPSELGKQILILLTLILGQGPTKDGASQRSEELQRAGFDCLAGLFKAHDRSNQGVTLTEDAILPHLLEAITLMLRGITDGTSTDVQLSAISALDSFQSCMRDKEVLASFFPGTISSLTKALHPSATLKRSGKAIQAAIDLFTKALSKLMVDSAMRGLIKSNETSNESKNGRVILTASWLKATSSQVKLALGTVIKLRHDGRAGVRRALCELCLLVLEQCRESLSETVPMIVETVIILAREGVDTESKDIASTVKHLAMIDHTILDSIKSNLHNWVVSLPRLMQSNDDRVKRRVIGQISTSLRLLSELGSGSEIVDSLLAANLRDSVSVAIQKSSQRPTLLSGSESVDISSALTMSASPDRRSLSFHPVLVGHKEHQETLLELRTLLKQVVTSESSMAIAQDMLNYLRGASGDSLLSVFWLSLTMVRDGLNDRDPMDELINYGSSLDNYPELLEELYSYSLNLLSRSWAEEPEDWRLQALALETIALQSETLQENFRLELVDALYPVVHLIGSPTPQLRDHAITCLNKLAKNCGYTSTSDLIISHVDYLVNAVALKLNTFDISPQAPQVLLMMIKLTGPSLIPYLEDLVESIYAALESYHGYPRLVELLFSVLNGIVEEGSKPDAFLAITSGREIIDYRKKPTKLRTVDDVVTMLEQRKEKERAASEMFDQGRDTSPDSDKEPGSYPRKPWKDTHPSPYEPDPSTSSPTDETPPASAPEDETRPPHTKTYTTIHSISHLTQHYLSNPSAPLRLSLLRLLHTSLRPLATDEDSFLPLVNDIWGPLVLRLHDQEPFVVAAAADTVALICRQAGDFMSGRVDAEWPRWVAGFAKWEDQAGVARYGKRQPGADGTQRGKKALATAGNSKGRWTQAWRTWEAWVKLWGSVLGYVKVGDDIRDEMLERLGPYLDLPEVKEVRGMLEEWNEDAVWWEKTIAMDGHREKTVMHTPQLDGVAFVEFT
ncbi:MAG: hypothetical protein M4579_001329 [Chaenotheca gracillima]|nr:MAG: hypothetical protein M4579_001329 [Chaenotheca gracillima]